MHQHFSESTEEDSLLCLSATDHQTHTTSTAMQVLPLAFLWQDAVLRESFKWLLPLKVQALDINLYCKAITGNAKSYLLMG